MAKDSAVVDKHKTPGEDAAERRKKKSSQKNKSKKRSRSKVVGDDETEDKDSPKMDQAEPENSQGTWGNFNTYHSDIAVNFSSQMNLAQPPQTRQRLR